MSTTPLGLRVLLVEDHFILARFVRRSLDERGHACSVASCAAIAIATLERERFDVVISDVRLGQENGVGVLEQVRVRLPAARRVLMSGAAATLAERSVAHAFLFKPFTLTELFDAIEKE